MGEDQIAVGIQHDRAILGVQPDQRRLRISSLGRQLIAQFNAVLKIPGHSVPALETSAFAEDVVYWHIVADTVELLAKKNQ